MRRQFIRELTQGMTVDAVFAVCGKEMRCTRVGDAFLALEVSDRTGRMRAVYFRPTHEAAAVPSGAVVHIKGTVTAYRGTKRISVDVMRPVDEYDPAELMQSSKRDSAEVVESFKAVAASVKDRSLRQVLKAVFGDEEFFARFLACPGARAHHHAHLGGLVEHTLSVATLCRTLGPLYDRVDSDLLVTVALLHDIGKVDELAYSSTVSYTDEGRLLGHVVLGERRMREAVLRSNMPIAPELLTKISHAMLSHHGELEWGSPRRPSTIEALLLHHADNLDAKADGFLSVTGGASLAEERWTDASNLFRRPLWAPSPVADERPMPAAEDAHQLVRA